jgi:hypothetical protein
MERWKDGKMIRWKEDKMERWKDGKMERWKGETTSCAQTVVSHVLTSSLRC